MFVAVGAQLPKYLGVDGEDSEGVIDALELPPQRSGGGSRWRSDPGSV